MISGDIWQAVIKKNVDQLIIYPALLVFCLCVVQKTLRYLRQRSGFSPQLVKKFPNFYISGNRVWYQTFFRDIVEG